MWQYRRPRKVVRNWIQYTGGALGLGIVSSWLFRHSRLGGSSDLDQWTKESVQAASSFLEEHVQQPVFFFYTLLCVLWSVNLLLDRTCWSSKLQIVILHGDSPISLVPVIYETNIVRIWVEEGRHFLISGATFEAFLSANLTVTASIYQRRSIWHFSQET